MKDSSFLHSYHVQPNVWDEMFASEGLRDAYKNFVGNIEDLSADEMNRRDDLAKKLFMSQGITFTVYNSGEGIEKIFPFDIIPVSFGLMNGRRSKKASNKDLKC